jgi:apolipoprotein D and lipocalin family protein
MPTLLTSFVRCLKWVSFFMKQQQIIVLGILFSLIQGCSSHPPLPVVDFVDLERYQGRWYEIASFPLRPQKNCTNTYAQYTLKEGEIEVYNHCIDSTNGKVKDITGKAYPESEGSTSKLRVKFFKFFSAPYHILALDTIDYQYALVGTPSREYLWILCREQQMAPEQFNALVLKATDLGFDVSRLNRTVHR